MKKLYFLLKPTITIMLLLLLAGARVMAGNVYSYSFNGTSESIYISNASALNVTDHWTFEAWINVNSVSVYDDFMFRDSIFSFQVKNPLGSGDFALDFYNRDNTEQLSTDASEDLTFNTWYHVAATSMAQRQHSMLTLQQLIAITHLPTGHLPLQPIV